MPAASLAVTCRPASENCAATTEALTGPPPNVAVGNVTVDCAWPLIETSRFCPANALRSNWLPAPAVPVACFEADVPARNELADSTISSSGPPTSAGRLPWKVISVDAWAGSVSENGTVMSLPEALTTRMPDRRSTSVRSESMPNEPTRE